MSFLFVDTFVMSEGALPEWGTFCEDQALKLADCFKQELRQFRLNNPQFDNVPTAGFARLFSASFLTHFSEEAEVSQTREINAAAAATSTTATTPPTGRQKVWKSIFRKRDGKDSNDKESSSSSNGEGKIRKRSNTMRAGSTSSSSSATAHSPFVEQPTVVMSSNMNMLQFNNQSSDNFDNLSWSRCHVSLCLTHGMYQLLIRCPPKVR